MTKRKEIVVHRTVERDARYPFHMRVQSTEEMSGPVHDELIDQLVKIIDLLKLEPTDYIRVEIKPK